MDRFSQENNKDAVSMEVDDIFTAPQHFMKYPEHENSPGERKTVVPSARAGLYINKGTDPGSGHGWNSTGRLPGFFHTSVMSEHVNKEVKIKLPEGSHE